MNKTLWFTILLGTSCQVARQRETFDAQDTFRPSFTGWDRFGKSRFCYLPAHEPKCPAVEPNSEKFRRLCLAQKFRVQACTCNDYLCEQNILSSK